MMKNGLFWRKTPRRQDRLSSRLKARQDKSLAPFSGRIIGPSLEENTRYLTEYLGRNMDFSAHDLTSGGIRMRLFFFQTLVDGDALNRYVVMPLQNRAPDERNKEGEPAVGTPPFQLLGEIRQHVLSVNQAKRVDQWHEALRELLLGRALLLLEGEAGGIAIDVSKVEKRSIMPPQTEQSVIGPRDSFVEDVATNVALIRQRLPDAHLIVESITVARRGSDSVALFYIADLCNPEVLKEVKRRLSELDVDAIRGQMDLQGLLEDNSFSLFPQMLPTERPDVTCSYLLEGSVAVMARESSHALVIPMTFFQLLTTADDYYTPWQYASLIRMVRMFVMLLSIATPGLYLSLVAYNPELIPTRLVISMDAARAKVALPIVMEIFTMEVMIEILREAGVKLPKPVGQAVSIVGGLVIGEAAVNANLVSPVTVVVVALTAISSFTAPAYLLGITFRILRFFLLLTSSFLGLYGFLLGLFVIHAHLCRLSSFSVPYLAPLSPLRLPDWRDTLVRLSPKRLTRRPTFLRPREGEKGQKIPWHVPARFRPDPLASSPPAPADSDEKDDRDEQP